MKRFFVLASLLVATNVSAQVTNLSANPSVTFTTPASWNATTITGLPKITNVQVDVISQNPLGALVFTRTYTKPAATPGTDVSIAVPELRNLTLNVIHNAIVTTIGNGDPGVSAPSNPFGIIVDDPLERVTNVRVS